MTLLQLGRTMQRPNSSPTISKSKDVWLVKSVDSLKNISPDIPKPDLRMKGVANLHCLV